MEVGTGVYSSTRCINTVVHYDHGFDSYQTGVYSSDFSRTKLNGLVISSSDFSRQYR